MRILFEIACVTSCPCLDEKLALKREVSLSYYRVKMRILIEIACVYFCTLECHVRLHFKICPRFGKESLKDGHYERYEQRRGRSEFRFRIQMRELMAFPMHRLVATGALR